MGYESLMPNLLIAGVTKAGTSSLFWYLIQHPEICAPVDRKEIDYFTPMRYGKPTRGTRDDYGRYFAHQTGQAYRLDASPHYFDGGSSLVNAVHEHLPQARILVILRDPVSRLWSTFRSRKEGGTLAPSVTFREYFEKCLDVRRSGRERLQEFNKYRSVSHGCYNEFLGAWFDAFGDGVRVLFFEHLVRDPEAVVGSTCAWLGIDATSVASFDYAARNKTVDPRSVRLSKFAHVVNFRIDPFLRRLPAVKEAARWAYAAVNGRKQGEELSERDREMAQEFYAPANDALHSELVRRGYTDFPKWLASSMSTS